MNSAIRRVLVVATLLLLPLAVVAQDNANNASKASTTDQSARREKFVERIKTADTNGDHELDKAEMSKGMPRLASHFDEIDANHDGKVSMQELRAYMQSRKGKGRQRGD